MEDELRPPEYQPSLAVCEKTLAALPAAVVVLDRSMRVRVWNREAERLFGAAAAGMVGQPYSSTHHDGHDRHLFDLAALGANTGRRRLSISDSTGRERVVTLSVRPVFTDSGEVVAMVGVYHE